MQELDKLVEKITDESIFSQFYDNIRIIEPGGTHRVLFEKIHAQNTAGSNKQCYEFWGRSEACANCVSKRSCIQNKATIKFEYNEGIYYLVMAKPLHYQENDFVMEVILNITEHMETDDTGALMKNLVLDITEKLENAQSKESFTNLYNKPHMIEQYNLLKKEGHKEIYLALLDIDNFKLVNDIYGHDLGDKAILTIANALEKTFTDIGMVARFGGDEFGIVFDGDEGKKYRALLTEFKKRTDSITYDVDGNKFHITISFGLAEVSQTESFSDAIHLVDKELFYAKRKGVLEKDKIK